MPVRLNAGAHRAILKIARDCRTTLFMGQEGPVPVPDAVAEADPAALAAEPVSLAFLAARAQRQKDANTAVRYLGEGLRALPDSTPLMIELAAALQARVVTGQSPVEADDLRRMEELAQAALDQRRRWAGPSAQALAMLIRRHMLAGAFQTAARLAVALPEGGATEDEACTDEVLILGTQAAMTTGDRELADRIGSRAASAHARTVVRALTADAGLPAAEQVALWRATLADDSPPESQVLALHRLACLGAWPLPELDTMHSAGVIGDSYRDILAARSLASRGEVTAAVASLRGYAGSSPTAAEILVDVLEDAERYEEALEEAARGFDRFGESILAHKRLNLLVLVGRPGDAATEAHRLLARADTAPELRIRTRGRLIIHYAHTGDWAGVEEQARAGLGESPDSVGFQWNLIAATLNQGRLQRAYDLLEQFRPEITAIPQAQVWLSLHMHYGFSHDDIEASLDMIDRWADDVAFTGQVLSDLATAEGLLRPDGSAVLPEMKPDTLRRFQDRITSYIAANPGGPIRPFTGTPQQFLDVLRVQQAALTEGARSITKHIQGGQSFAGALSAFLGRSYARDLLEQACGMLTAVTPDLAPFASELAAARAALDHLVVIETSAIVVATILPGRWPCLRGAFTEIRMTRDAWNDIHDARNDLLREPGTVFSISFEPAGRADIRPQATSGTHEYLTRRFHEISRAMNDLTLTTAPDLGQFAKYTFHGADPALSPVSVCAVTGAPLWSDDVAVRGLATQHGIPAFGTVALLHVLIETGRAEDTLRQDALVLARNNIGDLVLTAEEFMNLARENGYLPGPATSIIRRPLFWAGPEPAQAIFLELAESVSQHATDTLTAWLQAACVGLAARFPHPESARQATALAEAAATKIQADAEARASLIDAAKNALSRAWP